MTARNIIIIVFVFLFVVVISAFVFGSRQNTNQAGLASIGQVAMMQPLPLPSTVPPQEYITVPTAYYISSSNTTTKTNVAPAQPRTLVNPAPAPVTPTAPAPKPAVDPNYYYYRWNGTTYTAYYPYTPDHKAPGSTEDDLSLYVQPPVFP